MELSFFGGEGDCVVVVVVAMICCGCYVVVCFVVLVSSLWLCSVVVRVCRFGCCVVCDVIVNRCLLVSSCGCGLLCVSWFVFLFGVLFVLRFVCFCFFWFMLCVLLGVCVFLSLFLL